MNEEAIATNTAPATLHHPFSPSSLQMLCACPGAWRMQMGMEDQKGPEAEEGTRLHLAVATGNLEGLDQEQTEMVEACRAFAAEITGEGGRAYTEVPVTVMDHGEMLTRGTADLCVTTANGTLHVVDWKFGRVKVEDVAKNLQLAAYAVGAMQKFGAGECICHVFQPRIGWHGEYTFRKPEAILANIRAIIQRCKADVLTLSCGDHCAYCRARSACPALANRMNAMDSTRESALADPAKLEALYVASRTVKKFIGQIEDAFKAMLENGEYHGWTIQEKPGNREIPDIKGAYSGVRDYMTQEEYLECCKVSVAGLVSGLAAKIKANAELGGNKVTVKDCKEKAETMLAYWIQRGTPKKEICKKEA